LPRGKIKISAWGDIFPLDKGLLMGALQLRRCSVPVRTLHSSVLARLASGAFYKSISLMNGFDAINFSQFSVF
jgi:hypothetical protein